MVGPGLLQAQAWGGTELTAVPLIGAGSPRTAEVGIVTQPAAPRSTTLASGSIHTLWGVRYQVEDVGRSADFYTQQLGFTLDHKRPPAFAQVSTGHLELILSGPGASGSRPMPNGIRQEPGGWNRVILEVAYLPFRIGSLKAEELNFRNEMETGPRGQANPAGGPVT